MDFIDLKTQYQRVRESMTRRMQGVLDHGQYVLGAECLNEVVTRLRIVEPAERAALGSPSGDLDEALVEVALRKPCPRQSVNAVSVA